VTDKKSDDEEQAESAITEETIAATEPVAGQK
jgi:hypothetical protein